MPSGANTAPEGFLFVRYHSPFLRFWRFFRPSNTKGNRKQESLEVPLCFNVDRICPHWMLYWIWRQNREEESRIWTKSKWCFSGTNSRLRHWNEIWRIWKPSRRRSGLCTIRWSRYVYFIFGKYQLFLWQDPGSEGHFLWIWKRKNVLHHRQIRRMEVANMCDERYELTKLQGKTRKRMAWSSS